MREFEGDGLIDTRLLGHPQLQTQLLPLDRQELDRHVAVEGLGVGPALQAVAVGQPLVDAEEFRKLVVFDVPIQQIATISTPDPRSLLIQPWDSSTLKPIEKAILASDLGINPQNDGRSIRLVFPQLTEERRKELVKQVKKYTEDAKVAVRNIRRDAMDKFKAQKKASEITEDDYKIAEKDLQKLTDDWIKKIEKISEKKEKELFEI